MEISVLDMIVRFLVIILLIGLLLLFYFLWFSDIRFYLCSKRIKRSERFLNGKVKEIDTFINALIEASFRMMKSGKKIEYPSLTDYTIFGRFFKNRKFIDPVTLFRFQYSECGWIILSILEYSIDNDSRREIFSNVQAYFDTCVIDAPFETVDQSQCGMLALRLYKETHDSKYIDYADRMYQWLLTFDSVCGLKYREWHNIIVVDTIGMSIPFLMEYYKMFNIQKAKSIALNTVQQYILRGCDYNTGMPAYAYEIDAPNLKVGRANWGRGISWFVIGLCYVPDNEFSKEAQNILDKFNKSLICLWARDKHYGQFLGEGNGKDLSAELPILYYLNRKAIIKMSKEDILEYSTLMHDGIMYYSSSSNTGVIRYGVPMGPNMLSQAFMMRLLMLYK